MSFEGKLLTHLVKFLSGKGVFRVLWVGVKPLNYKPCSVTVSFTQDCFSLSAIFRQTSQVRTHANVDSLATTSCPTVI